MVIYVDDVCFSVVFGTLVGVLVFAVLYVCVSCFVVHGCAVSRRYISVCKCDMFSVVNVYLEHLKFCVLMVEGMSVVVNVMLSLMSVMSPSPALCNLSVRTMVKLCTLGVFVLGVSLVSRIVMISACGW